MKKVRFESPVRCCSQAMEDSECQSPRPFMERQEAVHPDLCYNYPRILPYSPDPFQRYECSNTSPYPVVPKTNVESINEHGPRWPSNDLELSMLDSSDHEPRHPPSYTKHQFTKHNVLNKPGNSHNTLGSSESPKVPFQVLSSIENTKVNKPVENLAQDNNFFIKRDNIQKIFSENINPLQTQMNRLSLSSENNPLSKKAELMRLASTQVSPMLDNQQKNIHEPMKPESTIPYECRCHHCVKIIQNAQHNLPDHLINRNQIQAHNHCPCLASTHNTYHCNYHMPVKPPTNTCQCKEMELFHKHQPQNAVDKKTWSIEKYEQNKNHDCMEVEKQNNVKEKREPTVSDLFKIIKLQNEQLQLLQEKVDKFISANNSKPDNVRQNCMTEQIALETVENQHKISIGVMTSFEMVRTSRVINKEIVTQTTDNAQIQCNRSQISIKEVVSTTQPVHLNFLDGIIPSERAAFSNREDNNSQSINCGAQYTENLNDDKTLNELSLYNVQVDNATTPLISPEQSLYLDVRDYSDSDSSSDDHSNVGWTYYNKVMTRVNGVLQDSEMPSSASALQRNTQQRVQMQIDKTNLSVTKRVKFGDDPLGIHQPHVRAASTDTSLKMNQLAAKYLSGGTFTPVLQPPPSLKPSAMPIDMSFATRNYMERHRLLHGTPHSSRSPPAGEMPRFLDITALKQQPKLL
ncbi:uncharacterized protein LOC135080583 [Ostrinia nubilalis]|uniref:uncharacterized protein LOC135080583 n=1 Tax=Ostrinia nubilalis TaxID=29057 RepID=UPI0030822E65